MTDEQRAEDDYRTADVNASLRAAPKHGIDPLDPRFQAFVTEHCAWVDTQWARVQPARGAYLGLSGSRALGLSDRYVADERFASHYGGQHDAEAIRAAIQHWANLHL
jgi:hypothetical protein